MFLLEEEVRNHARDEHNVKIIEDEDYVKNESSDGEDEEKQKTHMVKIKKQEGLQSAKNVNVRGE